MAYVNSSKLAGAGLMDRIAHAFDQLNEKYQQYRLYRQTADELASLSERELSDLGLGRSDIDRIAREAAYGRPN